MISSLKKIFTKSKKGIERFNNISKRVEMEKNPYLYYFIRTEDWAKNSWLKDPINVDRRLGDVLEDWENGFFYHHEKIDLNNRSYALIDDFGWYSSPNPMNYPSDGTWYDFRVSRESKYHKEYSEFREFENSDVFPVEYYHPSHLIECSSRHYLHFQNFTPRTIEDLKRNEPKVTCIHFLKRPKEIRSKHGSEVDVEKELLRHLYENQIQCSNYNYHRYLYNYTELATDENEKIFSFYLKFIYTHEIENSIIAVSEKFSFYKLTIETINSGYGYSKAEVYGYSHPQLLNSKMFIKHRLVDQNGNIIEVDCSRLISSTKIEKFKDLVPSKKGY